MAYSIRKAEYYHTTVVDRPEQGYEFLSGLVDLGINLLAFAAVPVGPNRVQFTVFPEDASRLEVEARQAGLKLDGPHEALLVQGDDELGALARIHQRLARASVPIYASTGVTDGQGSFGYIVYVREDQFERALQALEL